MELLVQLIITPIVLMIATKVIDGVYIKNFKSAVMTSLSIMIVGFFIGWLITFFLNVATLGILWIIGLGIITRTIANAIIIEIIDQTRKDFDTKGFMPSLKLAIALAIAWGVVDIIF